MQYTHSWWWPKIGQKELGKQSIMGVSLTSPAGYHKINAATRKEKYNKCVDKGRLYCLMKYVLMIHTQFMVSNSYYYLVLKLIQLNRWSFKYSFLILIMCTQLYSFKYSNLIFFRNSVKYYNHEDISNVFL